MLQKLRNDKKGFTLIELMIVVAIIGILAAIAIPQFAAYRIRSYNASAKSDVRNLTTGESALFADWQRYGVSYTLAAAGVFTPAAYGGGAGVICLGGDVGTDGIVCQDTSATPRGIQVPVGNGVSVIATTNVLPIAANNPSSFGAIGKHVNGDTTYGVDSDSTAVYQNPTLVVVGTAIVAGDHTVAVTAVDDYAVAAGWVVK